MKSYKNKYFHGFTTIDLILMLSIMFTIVSIVTPIVLNGVESSRVEIAQREIKKLAHEVAFTSLVAEAKARNIASENIALYEKTLGLDPWGNAYRKSIIKDAHQKPIHVVVWSTGANGVAETAEPQPDQRGERSVVKFGGDDFGSIAPVTR